MLSASFTYYGFILFIFILFSLSACGGGGGTSTSESNTTSSIALTNNSNIDDHYNTIERATNISINSSNRGNIESSSDVDFFGIQIPGAGTLNIYSTGSTDTIGSLYDFNGTKVAENDNGGGVYGNNFNIRGTVATASWYYISVRHRSSTGTGSYMVRADFTSNTTPTSNNSNQTKHFDCSAARQKLIIAKNGLNSLINPSPTNTIALTYRMQIKDLESDINFYCR